MRVSKEPKCAENSSKTALLLLAGDSQLDSLIKDSGQQWYGPLQIKVTLTLSTFAYNDYSVDSTICLNGLTFDVLKQTGKKHIYQVKQSVYCTDGPINVELSLKAPLSAFDVAWELFNVVNPNNPIPLHKKEDKDVRIFQGDIDKKRYVNSDLLPLEVLRLPTYKPTDAITDPPI